MDTGALHLNFLPALDLIINCTFTGQAIYSLN